MKNFPQRRVRYEYDVLSEVHFVEVVPNTVYYENEECALWEISFLIKFISVFPAENISFITDNSSVSLNNPTDILFGEDFKKNSNYRTQSKKQANVQVADKQVPYK